MLFMVSTKEPLKVLSCEFTLFPPPLPLVLSVIIQLFSIFFPCVTAICQSYFPYFWGLFESTNTSSYLRSQTISRQPVPSKMKLSTHLVALDRLFYQNWRYLVLNLRCLDTIDFNEVVYLCTSWKYTSNFNGSSQGLMTQRNILGFKSHNFLRQLINDLQQWN